MQAYIVNCLPSNFNIYSKLLKPVRHVCTGFTTRRQFNCWDRIYMWNSKQAKKLIYIYYNRDGEQTE